MLRSVESAWSRGGDEDRAKYHEGSVQGLALAECCRLKLQAQQPQWQTRKVGQQSHRTVTLLNSGRSNESLLCYSNLLIKP